MKLRPWTVYGLAMLLLCAVVVVAWLVRAATELRGIPDAYAKWDAATLVIEYMETHDGKWPTGWQDLQECHARLAGDARTSDKSIWSPSFDEIRFRIAIDWNADPAQLVSATSNYKREPFHIIRAVSGNPMAWSGAEPNQMILYYLKERRMTRPSVVPSGPVDRDGRSGAEVGIKP